MPWARKARVAIPPEAICGSGNTATQKAYCWLAVRTCDAYDVLERSWWKVKIGYHRRGLAQMAMLHVKMMFDQRVRFVHLRRQTVGMLIWCSALNHMAYLEVPDS